MAIGSDLICWNCSHLVSSAERTLDLFFYPVDVSLPLGGRESLLLDDETKDGKNGD